jgi:hypothetical protein
LKCANIELKETDINMQGEKARTVESDEPFFSRREIQKKKAYRK